jgi:hypothetical protein
MRLKESINQNQINLLKATYGDIKKINPNSPAVKKLMMALKKLSKDDLETLSKAKINFVSTMAQSILRDSNVSESVNEADLNWNAVQNAIINFLKVNTKILDKKVQAKDTEGVKGGLKSIISGLTNAQRSLNLESVNEASYTVKAENPYQFVNGAYAILNAYLRDEELGPKGKKELQNILKSLDYMRKYFFFKLNESVNEDVNFRDGKYRFYSKQGVGYLTYDGREISSGDFDWEDGSNSYWMYHSSWRGQKAFDTGKDVIAYFKSKKITTESVKKSTFIKVARISNNGKLDIY